MAQKPPDAPQRSSISLIYVIVALLNLVAALGTVGFTYYFKFMFKKPKITEAGERERLANAQAVAPAPTTPGLIDFDSITVNIMSIPQRPQAADGTQRQLKGKLHYATVGLSIELRDKSQSDLMETLRPLILDELVSTLGKKQFHELTTVQGRYILRSQILDAANHLAVKIIPTPPKQNFFSNVFFTQFIVQ